MNRCTLFMRLTGVPESSSPLSTLLSSEQALLCRSPLSRAPLSSLPRRSAASRPYGARRWDPHRRLQRRARDPIKKKATLCAVFSQV